MILLCFLQVSPLEEMRFMPQRLKIFKNTRVTKEKKTYMNAAWLAAGLMKLFLVPPAEICRATSRLEEYKVGSPKKKGTTDTVSFP